MIEQIDLQTVTILLNIGGLVWGAAKLSSSVQHLDETVTRIKRELDEEQQKRQAAAEERADLDKRVSILERFPPRQVRSAEA